METRTLSRAPSQQSPAAPKHLYAETLGECWVACTRLILEQGAFITDEDVRVLEVLGVSIHIAHPDANDELITRHGDPQVLDRTLAKFKKGIRMPDRPFTYGERIFEYQGVDQFEWLVRRLSSKPETKSATISLLIPGEQGNLPCLTTIDAKVRDGALHLNFFYRSQNVFGRQYANLLALACLQRDLATRCGAGCGTLRGFISSAHIYDFDLPDAARLIDGEDIRISDNYYLKGPASAREYLEATGMQDAPE